ncbi:RNA-directed DNA polymerase from mobile element jockey [Elysia marginata]|uniref:RNA-directed DNA polymerase from mobile element jockey n=1 Tax=Elysia marginata TaxID=1093978 RepID=A0AAV4JWT6_9GAST|nr:RNA-directed DNA polymerase from mobile element jockey [Elysia marginata]
MITKASGLVNWLRGWLTIDSIGGLKLTRPLTPTKLDLEQGNGRKTSCFVLVRRSLVDSRIRRTQQQCLSISSKTVSLYDRVWRKGLPWKMREVRIHGRLYLWVKYFLVNRMVETKINNGISSEQIQEEGLPQGSSLSCALFLIFINDLPDVFQAEKALYADDVVMWHINKHPGISARLLNEDLDRLQNYCDKWKLKIISSKTVYSVFTKSHMFAKKNIRLSIRGTNLKKEEIPIYLGKSLYT